MLDPAMIGIIGFLVMFALLFLGMPLGLGMALVGFGGFAILSGVDGALNQLGRIPFSTVASYTFSVLPLFVLMGEWLSHSGMMTKSFSAVQKTVGRLPGGLAMGTVATCTIFAACTGSSLATSLTMTRVSLPSMRKYKYDDKLSLGAIAAGGTLGILLPPSSPMIVYSIMTGASIGSLFIAGVIPGLLLSAMFMLGIYLQCKMKPELGPAAEKSSIGEILAASKSLWMPFLLVFIVLGGIWGGVFSSSEAGGIGAFFALVTLVMLKGFDMKGILTGLKDTVLTTAMILLIIMGAMIFGEFMTISGVTTMLAEFFTSLPFSSTGILLMILLMYIILGCVLDSLAMLLLTLPLVFPVIESIGIDPILFGVLLVITIEMSFITPPLGMVVFALAGAVKDVPMTNIFRGAMPFFVIMVIFLGILVAFPDIVLWLPETMRS
ncbi:TRAP transporter large permease [Bacillus tuaregi]|uniref:TRAP transporter large permease n=1 Tax=Bacillus tuaregi TaxID=1816695 RepID=UPI0013563163|nr:TRAP transporter large permease [Bacillus tuaregi]